MFSRSSFSDEMLEHTRTMLQQGMGRDAVVTSLRIRWNIDGFYAESLLRRVESELARPQTVRGEPLRTRDAADQSFAATGNWPTKRQRWFDIGEFWESNRLAVIFAGALLFFIVLFIAGIVLSATSVVSPDESSVSWTEQPVVEVSPGKYRFEGWIANETSDWAVSDPQLEIELFNADGHQVSGRRIDLVVSRVGPGETRFYSIDAQFFEEFSSLESELVWVWMQR